MLIRVSCSIRKIITYPRAGNFPVNLEGPTVGAVAAIPVNVAVELAVEEEREVEMVVDADDEDELWDEVVVVGDDVVVPLLVLWIH